MGSLQHPASPGKVLSLYLTGYSSRAGIERSLVRRIHVMDQQVQVCGCRRGTFRARCPADHDH